MRGAYQLQSLVDTDALSLAFREGYQTAIKDGAISYRRFFGPTERRTVLQIADCLANQVPVDNAFLLTKLSHDCVAVNVNISTLLRDMASIIAMDGDSLSAISNDQTQGVLIDQNPYDPLQTY